MSEPVCLHISRQTFFELCGGLVFRFLWAEFFVVKVDAIKSLALGECGPSLDGGFGFARRRLSAASRLVFVCHVEWTIDKMNAKNVPGDLRLLDLFGNLNLAKLVKTGIA